MKILLSMIFKVQNIIHAVDVERVYSGEKYGSLENTCRKMFLHIVLYCGHLRGGFCLMQRTNVASPRNSQNKLMLVPRRRPATFVFSTRSWTRGIIFFQVRAPEQAEWCRPEGEEHRPHQGNWPQEKLPKVQKAILSPLPFYLRCGGGVFSNEEIKAKNASYHKKWGEIMKKQFEF